MNPELLICCATMHEVSGFLDRFPMEFEVKSRTGRSVFSGKIDQKTYDLLITGPGVFNTAHALTGYLENKTPGFILQTGIAGVFEQTGLVIGDVAVATQEQYIHTGVQSDSAKHSPLPFDLIQGHSSTRQGIYQSERIWVNQCYKELVTAFREQIINVVKGRFITVSTITASKKSAATLYSVFSPAMEAMEGAASSHVALLYEIPFIEVRSASNFVGERNKSKWDIQKAVKQIPEICSAISHKRVPIS